MYKGRKCLMCDNLYCRRCKRSEMVQLARRLYLCSQCVRRKKAQERIKTKPVGPCGKCGKKKLVAQHARRCPRCGAVRCGMCKKLDMFKHGKKIWTCRVHHPHVPQNQGFAIDSSTKSMVLPRVVTEKKKKSSMDPVTACLRCASYFKQDHLMEGLWRRPGNQRVVREMYVVLLPIHSMKTHTHTHTHTQHRSEKWDSHGDVFSLSNLSPLDVCSLWKIYAHREDLPLGSGDMTRLIFTQTMNQEDLNNLEKIDAVWDLLCDLGTRHRKVVLSVSRNFDWIQRHKSTTKMTSKTLAMCFWPRGTLCKESLTKSLKHT